MHPMLLQGNGRSGMFSILIDHIIIFFSGRSVVNSKEDKHIRSIFTVFSQIIFAIDMERNILENEMVDSLGPKTSVIVLT